MHLKERPTYFVKNGVRKPVYYTVDARQLVEAGWAEEKRSKPVAPKPEPIIEKKPEVVLVEVPASNEGEVNLEEMTKAELLDYAKENNIEVDPYALKSTILEACQGASDG